MDFSTEKDAESFFDSKINSNYFIIERQIPGRRLYDDKPVKESDTQWLIPDRILHPTEKTFNLGWKWGPIAVEIKKSNMAIAPVFAQVMEQRQTILRSTHLLNTRIMPLLFAIFPCDGLTGDLHSISETQLILSCSYNKYHDSIKICMPSKHVLEIYPDQLQINLSWMPTSRKGSRGREK